MAAQKCLRENCRNKVDTAKRGEVFCPKHRDNAADASGAAKAKKLSTVPPQKLEKEVIEHDDPEFGGVPQQEDTEEPLEGVVIETPEQLAEHRRREAEAQAELERLIEEMGALMPVVAMYKKANERLEEIKAVVRERLDPDTYNVNGVQFKISTKDVFDAKLATAAAATEDADGNRKKPLITKAELDAISVMTPNAAKAGAHFKNRPEVLAQLKKEQRSISLIAADSKAEGKAKAA